MVRYTDSTLMPFGKYRGDHLISVPASYLIWWYEQPGSAFSNYALYTYIKDNEDVLRQQVKNEKHHAR